MKIIKLFILLAILPLLIFPSFTQDSHDDGGWKKEFKRDGFVIYTRKVDDSSIMGIKCEGIVKAPLDSIMANLRDVQSSSEWTPDQISKITLKDVNDVKAITISVSDMPWPLSHRELLLDNELLLDGDRKLLFILSKSVDKPKYPVHKDHIRAHMRYSNIGFRPISKNETYVELTALVDPKGSIPSWIINFFQLKWPVTFLKSLEKRANYKNPGLNPGLKAMLGKLLEIHNLPRDMFE